jgi:predicted cupin superfamily sugar epimerase
MPLPTKIKDMIPLLNLIPHLEGGFFRETYRSGSEPMSTMGQTGLDCKDPKVNLVVANGRSDNRPDKDERRNALTSIFWVPTAKDPVLRLGKNCSDHVHYYQGGLPFRYFFFNPTTSEFSTAVLGPELHKGHVLQLPIKGGTWKCGRIEPYEESNTDYDYTLIGEAVAPGFDFHDFTWITEEMLHASCSDNAAMEILLPFFIHDESEAIQEGKKTVDVATEFYEDGDRKEKRINERS